MIRALELADMEPIRKWRNESLDTLRTPFPLTKEQQEDWYKNEICNRQSRSRFWAIDEELRGKLVGYGGIENIQWENSIGEISLLIDPSKRGRGIGNEAACMIIKEGFNRLNLNTIYGECYLSNPAVNFWRNVSKTFNSIETILPRRKFLNGTYYDSIVFTMVRS